MTPKEIHDAVKALAKEIGPNAHVSLDVNTDHEAAVVGFCRPSWKGDYIIVYADDWTGAMDQLRAKWAEISADVHRQAIRKMALEIIRITADIGSCHDAALRDAGFSNDEIERYGGDACDDANRIASNGPFSITEVVGANAA